MYLYIFDYYCTVTLAHRNSRAPYKWCCLDAYVADAVATTTIAPYHSIDLIHFDQSLAAVSSCIKYKIKRSSSKAKRRRVRLIFFSIPAAAATGFTFLVLQVYLVTALYHAIVSSHYMPSCDDYFVFCRNDWCNIKVDEENEKSYLRRIPCGVVERRYN